MATPFVGEIRMFTGNFAPAGWLVCAGQLLSIQQYTELFMLVGTTYGGDGSSSFGLPDLRGRVPVHSSNNTPYGQLNGVEAATLTIPNLPQHTHAVQCNKPPGSSGAPSQIYPSGCTISSTTQKPVDNLYFTTTGSPPSAQMASTLINSSGLGQPHDNLQPFQVVNFIIATTGIYPSQS